MQQSEQCVPKRGKNAVLGSFLTKKVAKNVLRPPDKFVRGRDYKWFFKVFIRILGTSAKYTHETINTLYNLHKYDVQIPQQDYHHFNRDFMRKNPLPALGFEPTTFQLASSCQGITFLGMVSLFLLVASALGDLEVATKTVTSVTGNITQSLYVQ